MCKKAETENKLNDDVKQIVEKVKAAKGAAVIITSLPGEEEHAHELVAGVIGNGVDIIEAICHAMEDNKETAMLFKTAVTVYKIKHIAD